MPSICSDCQALVGIAVDEGHILGPSIASLDEIAESAAYLGDAKYFMVKNSINNAHFLEWDEATHAAYFKRVPRAVEITIPKLVEMATEQVELASVPFATFIANKKQGGDPASYSFVLRGYVRHWLGNVWAEYDRVGLTDVVDAKIVGAKQEVLGAPLRTSREPPPLPGDQPPGLHAAGRKLVRP
jgi:hypothetical protein